MIIDFPIFYNADILLSKKRKNTNIIVSDIIPIEINEINQNDIDLEANFFNSKILQIKNNFYSLIKTLTYNSSQLTVQEYQISKVNFDKLLDGENNFETYNRLYPNINELSIKEVYSTNKDFIIQKYLDIFKNINILQYDKNRQFFHKINEQQIYLEVNLTNASVHLSLISNDYSVKDKKNKLFFTFNKNDIAFLINILVSLQNKNFIINGSLETLYCEPDYDFHTYDFSSKTNIDNMLFYNYDFNIKEINEHTYDDVTKYLSSYKELKNNCNMETIEWCNICLKHLNNKYKKRTNIIKLNNVIETILLSYQCHDVFTGCNFKDYKIEPVNTHKKETIENSLNIN